MIWPLRKGQREAVLQAVVMEAGTEECRRPPGAGKDVETDGPGALGNKQAFTSTSPGDRARLLSSRTVGERPVLV